MRVPEEVEGLVEAVYSASDLTIPDEGAWKTAVLEAQKALEVEQKEYSRAARTFLVGRPTSEEDILLDFNQQLEEDNPALPKEHQAFTRLAEPNIALVVLYDVRGSLFLGPDGQRPVNLNREPNLEDVRAFLGNAVNIQHKGCVFHYAKQDPPKTWQENGLLRFHRVVRIDPEGKALKGEYPLAVDRRLGVVFTKPDERED
jgi:hypothetical protein